MVVATNRQIMQWQLLVMDLRQTQIIGWSATVGNLPGESRVTFDWFAATIAMVLLVMPVLRSSVSAVCVWRIVVLACAVVVIAAMWMAVPLAVWMNRETILDAPLKTCCAAVLRVAINRAPMNHCAVVVPAAQVNRSACQDLRVELCVVPRNRCVAVCAFSRVPHWRNAVARKLRQLWKTAVPKATNAQLWKLVVVIPAAASCRTASMANAHISLIQWSEAPMWSELWY